MTEEREKTNAEYMMDALDPVREVLEAYRDSLKAKQHDKVMIHIKEALRALAGEKHSSRKAAYNAAVFVRKAFAVRIKNTSALASEGDKNAASMVLKEMAHESWTLRALGYTLDDYNPAFVEGKINKPPLVRFEKMTPIPEKAGTST